MTTITKALAVRAFAPLLAAGALLPSTAHPVSAEALKSENEDRDVEVAAQRQITRPLPDTSGHVGYRLGAPDRASRMRRDARASYDRRQNDVSYHSQPDRRHYDGDYATSYDIYNSIDQTYNE